MNFLPSPSPLSPSLTPPTPLIPCTRTTPPLSPLTPFTLSPSPPCTPTLPQIKDIASSGRAVTTAHTSLKGLLGVDERPLAVTSGPLLAVTWSKQLGGEG